MIVLLMPGGSMAGAAYDAMSKALDGVNELIEDDPSFKPEIKPILDLTRCRSRLRESTTSFPPSESRLRLTNAARPPAPIAVDNSDKNSQNGVTNITFNQTNNSPEAAGCG